MGEIRSTMDIIMEKTKDLKMTDGEKESIQMTEIERKIRGLLQKYLDGVLKREGLKKEMDSLSQGKYQMTTAALTKECLDRLVLEGENEKILDTFEYLTGVDVHPLKKTLNGFKKKLEKQKKVQEKALRENLERERISGSAVIPNIQSDIKWSRYLSKTERELKQQLDFETKDLTRQN